MRETFQRLSDALFSSLERDEVLLCRFHGEDSDFVRFNRGQVRQAGAVRQLEVSLELIDGRRHASSSVTLGGDLDTDLACLRGVLADIRARLPLLPEDPYLDYAREVCSTERASRGETPDADAALADIRRAGEGRDLVGIYAAGGIEAGLANSLGQRNWYETRSFSFDWSFYHSGDKAVKTTYAGLSWEEDEFARKVETASRQLEAIARKPRRIPPGRYRVYLAPAAIQEVMDLLGGGFGLKAQKTRQSPLQRLAEGQSVLHPAVRLAENTAEGIAPDFQEQGFLRPPEVPLVTGGRHAGALVSPRSAREYGVPTNGASGAEAPESLDMGAGDVPQADVLERLGTGIYVGNLWYLNTSDLPACRTTGMTRFATFWVEGGEIQAPLEVMRFDETLYRMLGEGLVGLTAERDLLLDTGTWFRRRTSSGRFPGALVEDFRFTL